jgi:hypothetical protein
MSAWLKNNCKEAGFIEIIENHGNSRDISGATLIHIPGATRVQQ